MTPAIPLQDDTSYSSRVHASGLVPKLVGTDMELGNFIVIPGTERETSRAAARALLAEIPGVAARAAASSATGSTYSWGVDSGTEVSADPQDWGRRFLTSGGAAYIDLEHLELCSAETVDALDLVASVHALFRLARRACAAANAKLPQGWRIHVLANNSDGKGNSWGSHLSFLVSRSAYDRIFSRRLHHLLWLASYQTSSIVFTGQGKVGAENGRPPIAFQLSQRADFFEALLGWQTTYHRPIVNSRDEALCDEWAGGSQARGTVSGLARLHSIFFDHTLCHTATFLKIGVMQIVLAMLEAGRVNTSVLLADPVQAAQDWSRDLTLRQCAETLSGTRLSALEMQEIFCQEARRFVDAGHCDGIVPHAHEILRCWEETLILLQAGNLDALAPRLDWVRKFLLLQRAVTTSRCSWDAPAIKRLDHQWANLDLDSGLYWACERAGLTESLVTGEHIRRRETSPPENTRAWARSLLLLAAGPDEVESVDWDSIHFRLRDRLHPARAEYYRVSLANPLGHTRTELDRVWPASGSLKDLLPIFGAVAGAVPAVSSGLGERLAPETGVAQRGRAHPSAGLGGAADSGSAASDAGTDRPESTS